MDYTARWEDYQFRSPTYVDGHEEPYKFDLVKWEKRNQPIEVIDGKTGEKKLSTEYCFTIGTLDWNESERGFEFISCGLRYLEHYTEGLNEWVMAFAKLKEIEFMNSNKE